MKFLRNIVLGLALLAGAVFTPTARSADLYKVNTTTANVVSNILSAGGALLKAVYWINTTTNVATVKLYDISNTTTTIVQEAYTSISSGYATNTVTTFTNAAGIVMTNTVPGWYQPSATVSASTNERPYVLQFIVPASGVLPLTSLNRMLSQGLAVLPNQAGTYQITYENAN